MNKNLLKRQSEFSNRFQQKVYKVCVNKGEKRFYVEGSILSDNGITVGARFDQHFTDDGALALVFKADGKYKMSGKGDRPVLDRNGKWVTNFVGNAKFYHLEVCADLIIITPLD